MKLAEKGSHAIIYVGGIWVDGMHVYTAAGQSAHAFKPAWSLYIIYTCIFSDY